VMSVKKPQHTELSPFQYLYVTEPAFKGKKFGPLHFNYR